MKIQELTNRLQIALQLPDVAYAYFLHTDSTSLSKARSMSLELPVHSKYLVLHAAGFSDACRIAFLFLPIKSREKSMAAIRERALSAKQQAALDAFQAEMHGVILE